MWSAHWKSGPTWGYPPVGRIIDLTLSNGSVPGPIVYVIYNDPSPPPPRRHSTRPQCRGPITWQYSVSSICRRNAFYIAFLSRIHDSADLNHLMIFVGHWWMDSDYLHIIKLNLNKSKTKIVVVAPNHWPKTWIVIDAGHGNNYGSDAARNTAVILYHKFFLICK